MAREPKSPLELAAFRAESASPEEVSALIQHRIAQVDAEIQSHMATVENLRDERKKWLAVSGSGNGTALKDVDEGAVVVPKATP